LHWAAVVGLAFAFAGASTIPTTDNSVAMTATIASARDALERDVSFMVPP